MFTGDGTIKFNWSMPATFISCGGGGGGGGGIFRNSYYVAGSGGYAGAAILGTFNTDSTSQFSIKVGAKGWQGGGNNPGNNGGDSSIINTSTNTTLATCYGGAGGAAFFGFKGTNTSGSFTYNTSSVFNVQSGNAVVNQKDQGGVGGLSCRVSSSGQYQQRSSNGSNSPSMAIPFTGVPSGFSFTIPTQYGGAGGGGGFNNSTSTGGKCGVNGRGGNAGTAGSNVTGETATTYGAGGGGAGYTTVNNQSCNGGHGAPGVVFIYFMNQ
jgi:hypothetical protein